MATTFGRRVILSLPVLVLASACVDDVGLLDPGAGRDAGVFVPGDAAVDDLGRVETSVFDPEAEIEFPPPVVISPEAGGMLGELQGSEFEMVWTGRRYFFGWIQNIRGHLFVLSATIDPETGAITGPDIWTADYTEIDQAPERIALLWQSGQGIAMWSTEREVTRQYFDADGQRRGDPFMIWDHNEIYAPGLQLLDRQSGYLLLAGGQSENYVIPFDDMGSWIYDRPALFDFRGVASIDPQDRLQILWAERVAAGIDRVYLSKFDADFSTSPGVEVYAADSASPIFLGPDRAAVWDFDAGSQLFDPAGIGSQKRLSDPGYNAPLVRQDPTGPRVALVHESGVYRETNPLPTGLEAEAFNYSTGRRNTKKVLYDGTPRNQCLERVQAAISGARLGVAWVMGCATRILYFTELRGEL